MLMAATNNAVNAMYFVKLVFIRRDVTREAAFAKLGVAELRPKTRRLGQIRSLFASLELARSRSSKAAIESSARPEHRLIHKASHRDLVEHLGCVAQLLLATVIPE
jgi:hypothetical protein